VVKPRPGEPFERTVMALDEIIEQVGIEPYHREEAGVIYCGDCLNLLPSIPDKSVDMILCDLPYGTTACSWDTVIPFEPLWKEYKRVIKDNGAIVLTASQPFTSALVMSNIKMFKYEWIWHKNMASGFANARRQPMRVHESILIFYNHQSTYNPIKEDRDLSDESKNRMGYEFNSTKGNANIYGKIKKLKYVPEDKFVCFPKSVQKINCISPNHNDRCHPTQKPVALFEYLIRTYTNANNLVLDNCLGSGTTAVAAKELGRKFIGIEISEEYCKIAVKRLRQGVLDFG
jgi:site-specific DNA-methyltransferase (adenine-specific)